MAGGPVPTKRAVAENKELVAPVNSVTLETGVMWPPPSRYPRSLGRSQFSHCIASDTHVLCGSVL